jgi:hypothetical protein
MVEYVAPAWNSNLGIWWLASYPKSGNTWVRLFMGAYGQDGRIDLQNQPSFICSGDQDEIEYQRVSDLPLPVADKGMVYAMRGAVFSNMIARHKPAEYPLFCKTHIVQDNPGAIPVTVTNGAIYIARDPRDIALSYSAFTGKTVDEIIDLMSAEDHCLTEDATSLGKKEASNIMIPVGSWSRHVFSWCRKDSPTKTLIIKYEDLLRDPFKYFCRMLEVIKWPIDEDLVRRSIESTRFDALKSKEQSNGFCENRMNPDSPFFRQGKSGAWREGLTDGQISKIEKDHGAVMRLLGYDLVTEAKEAA